MDNAFFEGGLYLMLLGGAAALLRYVPTYVLDRFFTVSLYVRDGDLRTWVGEWLAEEVDYGQRCRLLTGTVGYRGDNDYPHAVLEPGFGLHAFEHEGRWYFLRQALEEGQMGSKIATLTIRTLGRDPGPLRDLARHVVDRAMERRRGKQAAYVNDEYGGWDQLRLGEPRPLSSVVLRAGALDDVVSDLDWFREARDWHARRGLPYRRGYLLVGPPGNGKSSLVQAIAGHYSMPLYVLTLSVGEKFNDARLASAMARIPGKALVVLEDIEKIDFGSDTAVTISGLLNAIDGPLASEGRLLVVTANDATGLPEPLLRSGRIDRKWEIDRPSTGQVAELFGRFFPGAPDADALEFASRLSSSNGALSMADVQQRLARCCGPGESVEAPSLDVLVGDTETRA